MTGGAGGIGHAAAAALAAEGAVAIIVDLAADRAAAAVERICEAGGRAVAMSGDASDSEFIAATVAQIVSDHGRIDVLVNNAGIVSLASSGEVNAAEWQRVITLNLTAPFFWSQAVARASMMPERRGAIVNVASIAGLVGSPRGCAYTASKHGLLGITKGLAVEWAPYGIRVNAICPGVTQTEMVARAQEENPAFFASRIDRIPLGEIALPEEQADAILFLASEQARNITGVALPVDGGTLALSSAYAVDRNV